MVNGTLRNKLQWNINRNSLFHSRKCTWNVVCEMASILSRPQCVQGLKPALEGIVVTTHDGACEDEIQSRGLTARDWTSYSHRPEWVVTKNRQNFILWKQYFPLKRRIWSSTVSRASPIVTTHGMLWRKELSPHDAHRRGTLCSWCATSHR